MMRDRTWFKLAWTITLMPSICLVLFYSFVLRARLVLGRWPIPYQPDPKSLGFLFHHLLNWLSFPALYLSTIAMFVLFSFRINSVKIRGFNYSLAALIFTSSLILWLILFQSDPGQFWEWFTD